MTFEPCQSLPRASSSSGIRIQSSFRFQLVPGRLLISSALFCSFRLGEEILQGSPKISAQLELSTGIIDQPTLFL